MKNMNKQVQDMINKVDSLNARLDFAIIRAELLKIMNPRKSTGATVKVDIVDALRSLQK